LLGGEIAGNGISKLFLTIAAAFAEAERDLIRERIGQVKADQKSRGRFLGATVPFGYRLGDNDELVPVEAQQEAILEMAALQAQGLSLRAIAAAMPPERAGRPEGPKEGEMRGYSTKLVWRDGDWWVSLLKDGQEVAFMSLDEWKQLGATQQAVEDNTADRAAAALANR
jgi:hypothetical protein